MKLATLRIRGGGGTVAARLDGETLTEIPGHADVGTLLANEDWREIARNATGSRHHLAGAELDTVVPRPSKVLCAGLNYTSHIEEMGRGLPAYPPSSRSSPIP
ncbi:hypothetical protein ABZ434_08745 [Streptomyces sp. NPDC005761]|uniref:hypothetical protein n=1 Tax=Streptomyces sp. NPDC005761 TaxID=3157066 RepID=UPI0033C70D16